MADVPSRTSEPTEQFLVDFDKFQQGPSSAIWNKLQALIRDTGEQQVKDMNAIEALKKKHLDNDLIRKIRLRGAQITVSSLQQDNDEKSQHLQKQKYYRELENAVIEGYRGDFEKAVIREYLECELSMFSMGLETI